MTHIPRAPRAVAQRQALGRRLRAHRLALGLTGRDLADHIGCGTGWADGYLARHHETQETRHDR